MCLTTNGSSDDAGASLRVLPSTPDQTIAPIVAHPPEAGGMTDFFWLTD